MLFTEESGIWAIESNLCYTNNAALKTKIILFNVRGFALGIKLLPKCL